MDLSLFLVQYKNILLVSGMFFLMTLISTIQVRQLKSEIELHLEENEILKNELNQEQIKSEELENNNTELTTNVEELEKEVAQLNNKINKLKEKNVVLCHSLEEFLTLRFKNRKMNEVTSAHQMLSGTSDCSDDENVQEHSYNLRSKAQQKNDEQTSASYNLRQLPRVNYTETESAE
jgi:predicted nuclease with TOPRIM domain